MHTWKNRVLAITAAALLASCGGGGGGSKLPTPPQPQAKTFSVTAVAIELQRSADGQLLPVDELPAQGATVTVN